VLARAGEGTVQEVVGRPEWVAKIFHPTLTDLQSKLEKIAAMVSSPPSGSVQSDGFVVLTWPRQVVRHDGRVVGYVMDRIDTATSVEIHGVSNPTTRANPLPGGPTWTEHATWRHLVSVAANLCLAVAAVHRVDAVIGDFQERNILVNDTTRVSLVDCDSMQFTDAAGRQFLCGIGRPEFTAPELAGVDLRTTAREKPSDLFALAVHVHLLLMGGNHPFLRGHWSGRGEQPNALALAHSADWAGGPSSRLHTHPLAPSVGFLPEEICRLFARAFTAGARDPAQRPTAAEWRAALLRIEVVDCRRGAHQIPTSAEVCPWCAIEAERATRRQDRKDAALAAAFVAPEEQIILPVAAPHVGQASTPPTRNATRRTRRFVVGALVSFWGVFATAALITWGLATSPSATIRSGTVTQELSTASPDEVPVIFVPGPNAPAAERQITYTVTGTKAPGDRISVTYTDAFGRSRTQQNVYIPWSLTVTSASPSGWGSIEASSALKSSTLNCSITLSDGTVVSSNNANSFSTIC
jgi:DNA-binding helix-hairpin-helix protein with protein kinase domain